MLAIVKSIPLALICACLGAAQAITQPVCKPSLTVKQTGFSEIINLRRIWTASIDIDASRCATTSGLFSLGFVRQSELAPELAFTEPFIWRQGQKQVKLEFWADEAVEHYWVEDVATCPCRRD